MSESLRGSLKSQVGLQDEVLVVGGTYDGGIVGLSLNARLDKEMAADGNQGEWPNSEEVEAEDKNKGIRGVFNTVFAFKAHLASIKDIDSKGNLLITASTDETMRIYNLKTRCDSGMLTKHQGSVTCVCLSWNSKYLISCGEDKAIYIWRCTNWDPVKSFENIHDSTPISADFHPSMKLALTLDMDGNLCMLDLLKGALAAKFAVPGLGKKGSHSSRRFGLFTMVKFSITGNYYAILSQREIVISSIANGDWHLSSSTADLEVGLVQVTSFCWVTDQIFLAGFSNGQFRMLEITRERFNNLELNFTISDKSSTKVENPHLGNRIKGICTIGYSHIKDQSIDSCNISGKLVTCDSTGVFVLFNFTLNLDPKAGGSCCRLEIVDVFDSDNRITCMVVEDKSPVDPLSLICLDNSNTQKDDGCSSSVPIKRNEKPKVIKKRKQTNKVVK